MSIEKQILEELKRFNQINTYILNEQPEAAPVEDLPAADPAAAPTDTTTPTDPAAAPTDTATPTDTASPATDATATEVPEPVDVENDPDVEEVDAESETEEGDTEEIDITDLVTSQQEIQSKQDEFMDTMFSKLDDLASKLENMDQIMSKINDLESKFEKYRTKTPEEKLELRSLDSYPYNQKLTDFFDDKEQEMQQTGKNEYVLTSDEVENFSPNEVKKTFNLYDKED